jgi:hypothetical protein
MDKVSTQRKTLAIGMLSALPIAVGLWSIVFYALPPIPGMEDPIARLMFTINCICMAVLFCFFMGIEAVSHERLFSKAINPLLGVESMRLKINLRYLQHTLEQLMLFIPGLLALSFYCDTGYSMRAIVATTVVWSISRFVFWIGYHISPNYRAPGLVSMAIGVLVLLYVCARFSYSIAGPAGVTLLFVAFAGIEAYLVYVTYRLAQK